MTDETPKMAPKRPCHMGRFRSGVSGIIMTMTPENTPAEPQPAMALPSMKAVEVGAAPQRAEPASNRTTAARKMVLLL
jgi:hypothetical protein